jgi:hypothetical protein
MDNLSAGGRPAGLAWRLAGILLLVLALSFFSEGEDYASIFGAKYSDAEQFLGQNSWIADSLRLPLLETRIALAVVFPEIIRFRALEDEIQVRALKVLYVQYGQQYANFSVGHFQMKPTFAEQVERDYNLLFSEDEKSVAGVAAFESGVTPKLRNERVLRLDDLRWQVSYLRLFMMVMDKLYGKLNFANDLEKLRFYATAYNAGFAQGEKFLRKMMEFRGFHIQLLFARTRYNYGDVAAYYFRSHLVPTAK